MSRSGRPKPFYKRGKVTIYRGDCIKVLPQLLKADLVLTDPPYNIGGAAWARQWFGDNGKMRLWGEEPAWDADKYGDAIIDLLLKAGKEVVIWGANNYSTPPARSWFIWDKKQKTKRAECEMAWTTLRSGSKIFKMSRIDAYWNKAWFKKMHPTEKPVQLMLWCLSHFPDAGCILDPFMGTGSTLLAAVHLKKKVIGIEMRREYCEETVRRLEGKPKWSEEL